MTTIFTFLFLLSLGCAPAFAQTGTLKGVVTDESGGVVAGAKVTLASSSGKLRETASNKDGRKDTAALNLKEGYCCTQS